MCQLSKCASCLFFSRSSLCSEFFHLLMREVSLSCLQTLLLILIIFICFVGMVFCAYWLELFYILLLLPVPMSILHICFIRILIWSSHLLLHVLFIIKILSPLLLRPQELAYFFLTVFFTFILHQSPFFFFPFALHNHLFLLLLMAIVSIVFSYLQDSFDPLTSMWITPSYPF